MDENTNEDWLKLLLYSTGGDKDIMTKIFAQTRTLHSHTDILNFVVAEDCGKVNSERLLGMGNIAARAGLTGGRQGARGI